MIKKIALYFSGFLLTFLLLVFYNYNQAQLRLKDTRSTQLSIAMVSAPQTVSVNDPANFKWHLEAPISFTTPLTTIYWSYDSSPGALIKLDSPQAVRYHNFAEDYTNGRFHLPDDFDLNLRFGKKGTVYYRAYAFIAGDHLWSAEQSIIVN